MHLLVVPNHWLQLWSPSVCASIIRLLTKNASVIPPVANLALITSLAPKRQQVHAQAVKGSVGHHLASSSFPFYRCALGAARPCPFRNMDPTEQQIWGRLCGKSALPIKTQAHNRLGTNAQTAKEQIQKWFANKSTCDLRTMGSAGKQEELATRGLLATTNVSKHWNIGTVASLQWDSHSIETKEARCTILSSRNNQWTMRWKLREIKNRNEKI